MEKAVKVKPENKEQARKPYKKPVVEQVMLIPEENILGSCRSASVAGFGNFSGCTAPQACINP